MCLRLWQHDKHDASSYAVHISVEPDPCFLSKTFLVLLSNCVRHLDTAHSQRADQALCHAAFEEEAVSFGIFWRANIKVFVPGWA